MESFLTNIVVKNFSEPISQTGLLTELVELALQAGWAKPGYLEAVLTREEKYPTGLHTRGVEVAIPHADPEWTLTPAMLVAVLDTPVVFKPMGGLGDDVQARFVFLLLIPNAETHLSFLQALAEFIEDEQKLAALDQTKDIAPLLEHFKAVLDQ